MDRNVIGVIVAILATVLLGWFAMEFSAWNKEQACVSTGGRNCGGPRLLLTH